MKVSKTAAVILAAGKGTRMKSEYPKVVHKICGVPLVCNLIKQLRRNGVKRVVVVAGYGKEHVIDAVKDLGVEVVEQKEQLGTGHALKVCSKVLGDFSGNLMILPGDAFIEDDRILRSFVSAHNKSKAELTVLSTELDDNHGYGRIIRDESDSVTAIREELDASKHQKAIKEINTGIYLMRSPDVFTALNNVKKNSKKGEYYLTDLIEIYAKSSRKCSAYNIKGKTEIHGVNDRAQLADVHSILKKQIIRKHQLNGVTVLEPENTYIEADVQIGRDTVIYPSTYIEKDVKIGKMCQIGPFCKIRSKSTIKDAANIGSFVEIVRSKVGSKTNIKHLSYIGDAEVGKGVNVGAGTITANYDGSNKHKTKIGNDVFIGSDTVLIAPVKVNSRAKTGAGSVITSGNDIPAGKTAVGVPAKVR